MIFDQAINHKLEETALLKNSIKKKEKVSQEE